MFSVLSLLFWFLTPCHAQSPLRLDARFVFVSGEIFTFIPAVYVTTWRVFRWNAIWADLLDPEKISLNKTGTDFRHMSTVAIWSSCCWQWKLRNLKFVWYLCVGLLSTRILLWKIASWAISWRVAGISCRTMNPLAFTVSQCYSIALTSRSSEYL